VTEFHGELDDIKGGRRQPAAKLIKAAVHRGESIMALAISDACPYRPAAAAAAAAPGERGGILVRLMIGRRAQIDAPLKNGRRTHVNYSSKHRPASVRQA